MGKSMENPVNNHRYERKFFITNINRYQVEQYIKLHPGLFREIYHERQINNIYLDTHDRQFYHENINGDFDRLKVRIRWYGNLQGTASTPALELKIKKGPIGHKETYRLDDFIVNKDLCTQNIQQILQQARLPETLKQRLSSLEPVLFNSYNRKYYQSSRTSLRLTIDWNMTYCRFDRYNINFAINRHNNENIVVELKYNADKDKEIRHHCDNMPFTMTKCSKYVNAIEMLYN